MSTELADLAVELYEDGWPLTKIADFYNAAGFPAVKTRWYSGSFTRMLRKRGVAMRPRGRPLGSLTPRPRDQFTEDVRALAMAALAQYRADTAPAQ